MVGFRESQQNASCRALSLTGPARRTHSTARRSHGPTPFQRAERSNRQKATCTRSVPLCWSKSQRHEASRKLTFQATGERKLPHSTAKWAPQQQLIHFTRAIKMVKPFTPSRCMHAKRAPTCTFPISKRRTTAARQNACMHAHTH